MTNHVHQIFEPVHLNDSETNFDEGPGEPDLCRMLGFSDCERCYFRTSTIKRITENVEQLQRGRA